MTEFPKRGEIFLVHLQSKLMDIKDRPALVVSLDVRNKLASDIIAVPLSTNLRRSPTHVLLQPGEAGVRKSSMAKCEQIMTIDKTFLIRGPFAGRLSDEKMEEVERAIMVAIGVM